MILCPAGERHRGVLGLFCEERKMVRMEARPELKAVWEECVPQFQEYLQKGLEIQPKLYDIYSGLQVGRVEYAIGSRYLHRGFYCPSPVLEQIITNTRRGRIAKRMTKATRPTNRYVFDLEGKLRRADTFYPNGGTKTEYIFHEGEAICGLTFDPYGHISEISVERYAEGKIGSYLRACCNYDPTSGCYRIYDMSYERYSHDEEFLDAEIFSLSKFEDEILGHHHEHRFRVGSDPWSWEMIEE